MNNNEPIFIRSNITGGHYALKTDKSSKPFENPMSTYRTLKLLPTDIVADIGAYVGEFSRFCLRQGVSKVYSYEPTPYTFEILKMNQKPGMEIINKAVVGDDRQDVELYISKGIGVTNSIAKVKGKSIIVPAIKYEDALKDATVVKIDVEGAEYSYKIKQPQLRGIILEFHPIANKPWKLWAENIMRDFENSGFKSITRPSFKSGWNLTGTWQR